MTNLKSLSVVVSLLVVTCVPAGAQDPAPTGAFRAVHLVNLTPQQVSVLQAWMADMNTMIAKAGHKEVRYRLFRVTGKQAGPYEYMWESAWPSGEVYKKIHDNPQWKAVGARHPDVDAVLKEEIYNRYVEVTEKR